MRDYQDSLKYEVVWLRLMDRKNTSFKDSLEDT